MSPQNSIYVITAATGNIGSRITDELLRKGMTVRVIGRDANRLKRFTDKGAQAHIGSVDDVGFLTTAFTGATAVFLLIPPNYISTDFRAYQNRIGESYATAVKNTGVRYVVNLSSIGAHLSSGGGPINGLYDMETRLNKLDNVNVLHLRPAYFMENLFQNIELIKNMGIMGSPLKPDLKSPMIATVDIAARAAQALLALNFSGKSVQELLGQRDLSQEAAAAVIGRALRNEPLSYAQFAYADAEKAMAQTGMSKNVAQLFIEMMRSMNEGLIKPTEPRTSTNTTATSIEEFAKSFVDVYNAKTKQKTSV
jgi:uncharacterized protein YbjT (DUF2867 family)